MSSYGRTIEKRIMRTAGLSRNKDGIITDQKGNDYGERWPRFIPRTPR
jgi:hypothetical protein